MISGATLASAGSLYSSITAKMHAISRPVSITWSTSGPSQLVGYLAGNVAEIEHVDADAPSPRVIFSACSKLASA